MTIKKIMAAALSAVLCVVLSAAAFAESLVPGGGAVGIRMTTDGVVVAGVSEVQTPNGKRSPAAEAGLKKGDVITRLGGADIGTAQDFKTALAQLDGSKTTVTIERGGKAKQLNITPAQDADGAWKLGLWLRDGVSGVGTLTFYDPETGVYGALGHSISGEDGTEEDFAEKLGEILAANDIKSVTLTRMQVPCCGGLEHALQRAIAATGKKIPLHVFVVAN